MTRILCTMNFNKDQQKFAVKMTHMFFQNFFNLFPCKTCRLDMTSYLRNNTLKNIVGKWGQLDLWGMNFHNHVNRSIGNSKITRDKYIQMYSKAYPAKLKAFIIDITNVTPKTLARLNYQTTVSTLQQMILASMFFYYVITKQKLPSKSSVNKYKQILCSINSLPRLQHWVRENYHKIG